MAYVPSHRSQLQQNGFVLSKTYGKSMRPLIWGGCHYVAVVPLDGEPIVGDLLMFTHTLPCGKERNIVHRLVEISVVGDQRLYITRGDNCLGCEYVHRYDIIGRVAEVHRISGFRPWYVIPAGRFSVTDTAYLIYSRFWMAIWPARRLCYRLRARVSAVCYRLLSILKTDK